MSTCRKEGQAKGAKNSEGITRHIQMRCTANKTTTGRIPGARCAYGKSLRRACTGHITPSPKEKTSLLLLNLTTKERDSRITVRLYQEFTGGMDREQRSDRCKKGDGRNKRDIEPDSAASECAGRFRQRVSARRAQRV